MSILFFFKLQMSFQLTFRLGPIALDLLWKVFLL